MNEREQQKIEQLLRQSLPPTGGREEMELHRDLWPAMLKRLEPSPSKVLWFDWALLAALVIWLVLFPETIPVLLYHL